MGGPEFPGTRAQRHWLLHHRDTVGAPWPSWPMEEPTINGVPAFTSWRAEKRKFTREEVAGRIWTKTCTAGYITELHFAEDGTVDEYTLFDRRHVAGNWTISDEGTLEITLLVRDLVYQIEVLAMSVGAIHTAVEFENGKPHAFLKLMQLSDVS